LNFNLNSDTNTTLFYVSDIKQFQLLIHKELKSSDVDNKHVQRWPSWWTENDAV